FFFFFFFSSRRRHTRSKRDWNSDVCSSDLLDRLGTVPGLPHHLDVLGRVEDRAQVRAHHRLVVDDQDWNHGAEPASFSTAPVFGSIAPSANPPTSSGHQVSVPPSSSTRRRSPSSPVPEPLSTGSGSAVGAELTTSTRIASGRWRNFTATDAPGACLRALVNPSCTNR